MELLVAGSQAYKGAATHNLLKEKENEIHIVKNEYEYSIYSPYTNFWADIVGEIKRSFEYWTNWL